jgi:hypothetical protein
MKETTPFSFFLDRYFIVAGVKAIAIWNKFSSKYGAAVGLLGTAFGVMILFAVVVFLLKFGRLGGGGKGYHGRLFGANREVARIMNSVMKRGGAQKSSVAGELESVFPEHVREKYRRLADIYNRAAFSGDETTGDELRAARAIHKELMKEK